MLKTLKKTAMAFAAGAAMVAGLAPGAAQAWEPTKPVTFIIPAGTGGPAKVALVGRSASRFGRVEMLTDD